MSDDKSGVLQLRNFSDSLDKEMKQFYGYRYTPNEVRQTKNRNKSAEIRGEKIQFVLASSTGSQPRMTNC